MSSPLCPGCGGAYDGDGPTHRYVIATAGCWSKFNALSVRSDLAPVWPRAVNTYTAQHPGNAEADRRQRQSVALHLIGLHWDLELAWPLDRVVRGLGRLADGRDWPLLSGPVTPSWLRVGEVSDLATVRAWAESVWSAWTAEHERIRTLAASFKR